MPTISCRVDFNSSGTNFGMLEVSYSVASSDGESVITVTRATYTHSSGYGHTVGAVVKIAGTSVWSTSGKSASYKSNSLVLLTSNKTKTIAKTHSSQSVAISITLTDRLDNFDGNAYSSKPTMTGSDTLSVTVGARTSYTVSYNANSGSGAPSSQTKWYGESLTLTSTKPTRSGYAFSHWNTNISNTGTSYNPGSSYTGNTGLTLYAIWNPLITYNGNGGGNVPAAQIKGYGTSITLSSTVPTRTGYQFVHWNTNASDTGTSYSPGATYTSNTALTLYAIWRKVAQAPTISGLSAIRCNASGTADDSGTYCKVTASWSVDTSSDSGMSSNRGTVTGTIVDGESSSSRSITFGSGSSGTSGTATAIVSGCDTDSQYVITVTVTNSVVGVGNNSRLSTSRSDILTRAFLTMDFAKGGRGIGMGCAAPTSGLECGFDAQFDGDLEVMGELSAPNLILSHQTGSDVASPYSDSSWGVAALSTYGYRYGPFALVSLYVSTTAALTAGTQYTVCIITTKYRPIRAVGFSNQYGHGYISSGGAVHFRPTVGMSANSSMYIGATYLAYA